MKYPYKYRLYKPRMIIMGIPCDLKLKIINT